LSHAHVRREVTFANGVRLAPGRVLPTGRAQITIPRGGSGVPERIESFLVERVPPGEVARLDAGPVRFLQGERRQLHVERSGDGSRLTEQYELRVRNLGDDEVVVRVVERLARSGAAEVFDADPKPEREDGELRFVLTIEPRKDAVARYRVTYRW
jgi:hypothetical protein